MDAADEEDGANEGRVSRHIVAVNQGPNDDEQHEENSNKSQEDPDVSRSPQGRNGEAGNAFNGQVEEFPIVPLGLAGSSGIAVKEDFFLFKSDPTEKAFVVSLGFAHHPQGIQALAVEEAKITDVALHGRVRQLLQDGIKGRDDHFLKKVSPARLRRLALTS